MNPLLNPDWPYIITAVSIILSIWSLLLSFRITSNIDLTLVSWKTNLRKIGGKKELNSLTLIFQNLGRNVIYKKDLARSVKIQVFNINNIEDVIVEANCKYNEIYSSVKNDLVSFDFDFLEPTKLIKVSILYASSVKEARVTGKVIGGDELDYRIETDALWHKYYVGKREWESRIVFPFVTISAFLVQVLVVRQMFQLDLGLLLSEVVNFKPNTLIAIAFVTPIVLLSVRVGLAVRRAVTPFAVFARNEKNWYRK
jgi:hypothetical protein